MAPKATIKDVARLAQVSPSTVSRALRDHPRISRRYACGCVALPMSWIFIPTRLRAAL